MLPLSKCLGTLTKSGFWIRYLWLN